MEVAGSAVGIASLGIQVCQGLIAYIDSWKDYGYDVAEARNSISDLHDTLALLEDNLQTGGLDVQREARITNCVQSCKDGIQDLATKLDDLQKYSKPDGLRQKARAEIQKAVYPFRKDTLTKLRGNVADVRERLKLALQVLQLSVLQSDRWRKIVDWLAPSDPWTNHRSARDRHEPHTGDWLLQSPTYLNWKAGQSRHLWICGKAGCGKTVLSSTMIEDIKKLCETDENLGRFGLGAFYFTFSDKQKQSYEDLLRSLVGQLAWKPNGIALLQRAYEDPSCGRPGKDELEKILLLSLQAYDQVFLALDALDESPEENDIRQTMLERLEKLVQNACNVKLLATSREVRDIQESMGNMKAERINVADLKVDKDIRKFVVSELSKDRRLSRLSDKTSLLIEDTLSARADGMFRWAYCQIQELKKLKSTKSKYIEDVLRSLPKTLDETYERILCAVEERYRPEALTLLRWITYSRTPLTLGELAEAAIIDPSGEGTVDIDNRGDIEDSVDILSGLVLIYKEILTSKEHHGFGFYDHYSIDVGQDLSSEPLLETAIEDLTLNPKSKVRLAHFSVKEYLESKRILDGTAKDFHLDAAKEHRILAQSCVTYIIHYNNDTVKLSPRERRNAYPLLKLSAKSWCYHSSLQSDGDLEREVRMLTDTECLRCWLRHDSKLREEQSRLDYFKAGKAIYLASCARLPKVVEELLARDADVNAQGSDKGNALQAASSRGFMDIVELLLARGADVNASEGHYGSALQAASYEGYKDVVELLLARGADTNALGGYFGSALQAAAETGSIELVERLLAAGADINAQGGKYGNALQAAARSIHGAIEIVERLLATGADVNAQGGCYGNALQAAVIGRPRVTLPKFLPAGTDVNAQWWAFHPRNVLQEVARSPSGSIEVVERLLTAGADVNTQGGEYGNALQAAALSCSIRIVERLFAAGANVNAQGGPWGNALQAAANGGSMEVVERFLTAGANVNAQGGYYGNALQAAAEEGSIEVVERLLTTGANVNAQGGYYGNALQAAAEKGSIEIVERLIAAGANVNAQGGKYGTALQAATISGSIEAVETLLATGAEVDAQGGRYGNALQAAACMGLIEVVERLLTAGADVNAQGGRYGNALQAAARWGSIEVAKRLLAAGADVNAQGGCYGNALRAAKKIGYEKVADMLLAAGAVPREDDQP
ncbi:hypothetical protein D0869_12191 [Hortaea werneckii]|uniref:Nephrocystin 3-like N-terminal domain-containing protein n=1 Tax=Hortaea werneckii TaxID=91943 RepID=A0A3M6W8L6_HORWE|nr:hypothetical protein D0869_12191 [Hortaea werneckii]